MCRVQLVDKRNTEKLIDILGLKEAADGKGKCVRWYGHILGRPEKDVLMMEMVHEVDGKHKKGQPKIKWREQVEGSMRKIGLKKEDAADWCRKSCKSSKMHLTIFTY